MPDSTNPLLPSEPLRDTQNKGKKNKGKKNKGKKNKGKSQTEVTTPATRSEIVANKDNEQKAKRKRRNKIIRRSVALVIVILMIPIGWSMYQALSAPGTDRWQVRVVEWFRDHGMNSAINTVEHWWYSENPPPKGGTVKGGLPEKKTDQGSVSVAGSYAPFLNAVPHLSAPTNMIPLVADPLAGEGVWQPTGRQVAGYPAVYQTFFRPDTIHTSLVAGAMWLDTSLLKADYVVGLNEPPNGPKPWGAKIPEEFRPSLVAAFNSGFKMDAARGGVFTLGQMVTPLADGAASLVIDTAGKASVGLWGRDFVMGPSISSVRQNLALLVDNGEVAPGIPNNTNGAWGATLGNKVFVWRSGVGTTATGAMVYVGGPGLNAQSLAILLQRAGAVRAMELDINTDWVSAYTYSSEFLADPAQVTGTKLLPEMVRGGDRYLVPGERDFFSFFGVR